MQLDPPPKRRKADVVSLETLDVRVSALEESYQDVRRQVMDAANEMRANTRLTEEIHGEVGAMRDATAGIVEFVDRADASWQRTKERAARLKTVSYAIGKWLGGVCGGAYALLLFGRAMNWWA